MWSDCSQCVGSVQKREYIYSWCVVGGNTQFVHNMWGLKKAIVFNLTHLAVSKRLVSLFVLSVRIVYSGNNFCFLQCAICITVPYVVCISVLYNVDSVFIVPLYIVFFISSHSVVCIVYICSRCVVCISVLALWSAYLFPVCGLYISSHSVVCISAPGVWSVYRFSLCGLHICSRCVVCISVLTLWSAYLFPVCGLYNVYLFQCVVCLSCSRVLSV